MNQDDVARIALAVTLSVVGAIAVTKAGIDVRDGIMRWLIFSFVAGIVINTQEGRSTGTLAVGAGVVAVGLIGVILWLALLNDGVVPALSGVRIDVLGRPIYSSAVLGSLWIGSAATVLVCAFARPMTLSVIHSALAIDVKTAKRVEKLLRAFVAIAGAASLLVYSFV